MKASSEAPKIPHDWTIENWRPDIYPYDGKRGRHVLRIYRKELVAAGALTRIGREIVVLGAGYVKWLESNKHKVFDFDVPANRDEHAHKRFGRAAGGDKSAPASE